MQFESIEAGRWAGLMPPSAIRLRDYRALDDAPKMIPTIRDIGFGPGYKGSDYAKAWALIYYLRVQQPMEFVALLDTLRAPNGDGVSAGIRASESLSKVLANDEDTRWRRFMKELPTAGVSAKQEK